MEICEEDSNMKEAAKKQAKDIVTKVFNNLKESQCPYIEWINPLCLNAVRRDRNILEGDIESQLMLQTAVKSIKFVGFNENIPQEWPPVPLYGDNIDKLLEKEDSEFLKEVSTVYNSFEALSASFFPLTEGVRRFGQIRNPDLISMDIDFIRLEKVNKRIASIWKEEIGVLQKILSDVAHNLLDRIQKFNQLWKLKSMKNISHFLKFYSLAAWRNLAIIFSNEALFEPFYTENVGELAGVFFALEEMAFWDREAAMGLVSTLQKEALLNLFKINQQHLTCSLLMEPEEETEEYEAIRHMLLFMDFIYYSSRKVRINKIDVKEFHNDVLNIEWSKDMTKIYLKWFHARREIDQNEEEIDFDAPVHDVDRRTSKTILFIDYPWLFDAANKSRLMNYEGQISRKREMSNSLDIISILSGGLNMFLTIEVGRDTLIEDSLNCLVNSGKNLKKELKVKFRNEPGIDEGGVQKEFFQLLVKQIFDVEYGMFEYNEESQLYWIRKDTFEIPLKFELVGIILGLAIYNSHILDIHLPLGFYKKLLGKPVTIDDFEQLNPQVAKSLRSILNYNGDDFKEVMCLTFIADYESWGTKVTTELVENGKNIDVTLENRDEYVQLFVDFMMSKSVEKWFGSFKRGFDKWCQGEVLPKLEPEDLEMIICGSKVLDFEELKKSVHYQDGYTEESQAIGFFWEVLDGFNEEEKKKFLFFTTGCDKAPINGLKDLKLYISRHGDNQEHLPWAHTCFNHILLPDYTSAEKMREKLLIAIHNSEGFGLM